MKVLRKHRFACDLKLIEKKAYYCRPSANNQDSTLAFLIQIIKVSEYEISFGTGRLSHTLTQNTKQMIEISFVLLIFRFTLPVPSVLVSVPTFVS